MNMILKFDDIIFFTIVFSSPSPGDIVNCLCNIVNPWSLFLTVVRGWTHCIKQMTVRCGARFVMGCNGKNTDSSEE